MGLIDLLYVQILARGNSGATGMESKTQYNNIILYDATQKGGFVCVRVRVCLIEQSYVRNVQECVFVREQVIH